MGGRGSQGGRLKSSPCEGALTECQLSIPSPLWGGSGWGCRRLTSIGFRSHPHLQLLPTRGRRAREALRHEAVFPPLRGVAAVGFVLARLGPHEGKRGRQGGFAALRWSGRRIGSGREFRPDGKHLASRARLFDPEPRAPAGSGTNPQTRFTAHPVRSP
jgi:hypothetical protein